DRHTRQRAGAPARAGGGPGRPRLAGRQEAAPRARRAPARAPQPAPPGVGEPDHGLAPARGDDPAGDPLGDHLRLRQLRRGPRDRQRRGAAPLRARPLRADHPAGRRDQRGRRHRPAAARRAGALAVPEVLRRPRAARPRAGRVRAGREPHRQHGGGQLRRRARARDPPAAGRDPRAVDTGPAGARAAAHPPDHRRPGHRAGAAADRAAARRHPHAPRQGRRHRHHRCAGRRHLGGQPPGADRGRVTPDGRERHHHRALVQDRADARHDRSGPRQDEHHRRPAGRHRGGRAPARLQGHPSRRRRARPRGGV
ncbi:MAG: RsbT co-antagonist protein RsbRA, partial [uncultured Frankineae bacterium]